MSRSKSDAQDMRNADTRNGPAASTAITRVQRDWLAVYDAPPALTANIPSAGDRESILQIIWNQRHIVLVTTAIALAIAIVYILLATRYYFAGARIYVEQSTPKIINNVDGDQVLMGGKNPLNTQASLLKERVILQAAVDKASPEDLSALAGEVHPVKFLAENLRAEVGSKDEIITVWLESPHAEPAARMVNHVLDAYLDYWAAKRADLDSERLDHLLRTKPEIEAEFKERQAALHDYQKQYPVLRYSDDAGNNIITQRLITLQEQVTKAEIESLEARAKYEAAVEAMSTPQVAARLDFINGLRASGVISEMDRETASLREELARLETRIASQNMGVQTPTMQAALKYAEQLKNKISERELKVAEAYLASAKSDAESTMRKLNLMRTTFEDQKDQAKKLTEASVEFERLKDRVDTLKAQLNTMDTRINELMTTKGAPVLNIHELERAMPGVDPVRPAKTRTLALALVLGALAGSGLGLLRARFDERLKSGTEIMALLGLPVLGGIPRIPNRPNESRRPLHRDPLSEVAEAYRSLRTAVYYGASPENGRTILVTSPTPGDGKTTIASGIAVAMAQSGERVLIIDADFRKPAQHRVFEITSPLGIVDVLTDEATLDQAIVPTPIRGLDILPCGKIPSNPAEILNSAAFAELLEELTSRYHRVVLDSPPATSVTDARILGAMADMTLLVLRADKTTRREALSARDGLASVGARIFGTIVNDVPQGFGDYGFYTGGTYPYRNPGVNGSASSGEDELSASPEETASAESRRGRVRGSRVLRG